MITDLPAELQLMIFDAIKKPDKRNPRRRRQALVNQRGYSKHSENAARRALFNLSLTCRKYRSLLVPTLFDRVTLLNETDSAASVVGLATSELGHYVKHFRFEGSLQGEEYKMAMQPFAPDINEGSAENLDKVIEAILPTPVHNILSDLHDWFSNLEIVRVHFEYDNSWGTDRFNYPGGLVQSVLFAETSSEPAMVVKLASWEILMTKAYEALYQNKHPIKSLHLQDLLPGLVSTFATPDFHKFLSRLETFKISVSSSYSDDRFFAKRSGGDSNLYKQFGNLFFNHLASVKHLTIKAGLARREYDNTYPSTVPFATTQTPMLKSIRIQGILISMALIDFLANHCNTLEHVFFDDCVAAHFNWATQSYWTNTWGELFKALAGSDCKSSTLRKLDITPIKSSEIVGPTTVVDVSCEEELFTHAKAGMFVYVVSRSPWQFRRFIRRDDMRWYQAVREVIRANKGKGRRIL
ncbi:uncharacterized protein BDZ99DRAFT_544031 [Mytilinidion resinicola]|uniref:F-box domain-containing protein n=1 Tax=Mytilinidion resinicola TaxID=574789 RepID=A0A6A6Y841_9PEZI|nr:uncharacterized protein BDZ99DRAFT_544031 [Mytilinidion resinicola]KAF2804982.1 hypothetical protein BDZ99DRAFT_544031 [Mytilinidion resinicola]